jgi:DNA-binding GntR family transcriptional regulator
MSDASAPALDVANNPPLYELIYQVLRDHLAEDKFPEGLVIGEANIARAFNTSRMPASAALKRLVDDGLLIEFSGRGCLVPGAGPLKPVRLELREAGLELPDAVRSGLEIRNRPVRLYPEVEHSVAACLAHGRFLINESALADHYGVSRAIAHDVMTRLERTGLISQDSNQRWYAGPLTPDRLRDHFEMRWTLEPVALCQAAELIEPADFARRRRHAEALGEQLEKRGLLPGDRLEAYERELHIDVVHRCTNDELRMAIHRNQLPLIATHSTFHDYQSAAEITTMAAEHAAIFDHLAKGEVAIAASALRDHLRRSLEPNIDLLHRLGPLDESDRPPYLVPVSGS